MMTSSPIKTTISFTPEALQAYQMDNPGSLPFGRPCLTDCYLLFVADIGNYVKAHTGVTEFLLKIRLTCASNVGAYPINVTCFYHNLSDLKTFRDSLTPFKIYSLRGGTWRIYKNNLQICGNPFRTTEKITLTATSEIISPTPKFVPVSEVSNLICITN